ncbi:DUF1472 domain-containing protein [Salmonella enterica]|nr:DUF1472 domain-containing protein [Salmonella enterica]
MPRAACGKRRASTIAGPRLMQGKRKRRHLHPVAVYLKGIIRRLPVVFRLIFRRQTVQPAPAFYCAAASVTPLHPPLFARLSCRHGVSRNSDDIDYGGFSMSTTTTTPAVYVGTYHKYNCGSIFGKWFELTEFDGREDFYEACQALHADEWDAEFMFQDWEGIPSQFVSECSIDWDFIAAYKRAEEEGREAAFISWAEYTGECDYDAFDDAYRGEAESEEDYAQEMVEDHGLLNEVPEPLRSYFDFEAYARDLFSSGYVFHDGYVFSN